MIKSKMCPKNPWPIQSQGLY